MDFKVTYCPNIHQYRMQAISDKAIAHFRELAREHGQNFSGISLIGKSFIDSYSKFILEQGFTIQRNLESRELENNEN